MLPLKGSCSEQHAVIRFKSRQKDYCKCQTWLGSQWLLSFSIDEQNAVWQKFAYDAQVQSVVWTTTIVFFTSGIQKLVDSRNKCLNEFRWYVEKWNNDVAI